MRFRHLAGAAAVAMLVTAGCTAQPSAQHSDHAYGFQSYDAFSYYILQSMRANEGDVDAINWFIAQQWPNPSEAAEMRRIVNRESRYQPWAKNPRSTASGLTQQLNIHAWRYEQRGWDWNTDRFDAFKNLLIARELFDAAGFAPWRCC